MSIVFVNEHRIGGDRFEFQMLFGVRPQLQLDVLEQGIACSSRRRTE